MNIDDKIATKKFIKIPHIREAIFSLKWQYLGDRFLTKNGRDWIRVTMHSIGFWFPARESIAVQ